jgi:hypothetical protein
MSTNGVKLGTGIVCLLALVVGGEGVGSRHDLVDTGLITGAEVVNILGVDSGGQDPGSRGNSWCDEVGAWGYACAVEDLYVVGHRCDAS